MLLNVEDMMGAVMARVAPGCPLIAIIVNVAHCIDPAPLS